MLQQNISTVRRFYYGNHSLVKPLLYNLAIISRYATDTHNDFALRLPRISLDYLPQLREKNGYHRENIVLICNGRSARETAM